MKGDVERWRANLRDEQEGAAGDHRQPPRPGVRSAPPAYVSALMEGQPVGDLDKALRGVLVIQGPHVDSRPPEGFRDWLQRRRSNHQG